MTDAATRQYSWSMSEILQSWLDRYLTAWQTNDPADIRALFTPTASYATSPLDPAPWTGVDAIVDGWLARRDEPRDWSFTGGPLALAGTMGFIEGRTTYTGGRVYANLWVVRLAADGRAESFVEWFVEPDEPLASGL